MKRINLNIDSFKSDSKSNDKKSDKINITSPIISLNANSTTNEDITEENQSNNIIENLTPSQRIFAVSIISQIIFNSIK